MSKVRKVLDKYIGKMYKDWSEVAEAKQKAETAIRKAILEEMPKEKEIDCMGDEDSRFKSGFNACRQQILDTFGEER